MRTVSLVALLSLLLASCGEEFCFGPFGNCYNGAQNPQTGGGGITGIGLRITILPAEWQNNVVIPSGTSLNITVVGGGGPYDWRLSQANGAQIVSPPIDPVKQRHRGDTISFTVGTAGMTSILEVEDTAPAGQVRNFAITAAP